MPDIDVLYGWALEELTTETAEKISERIQTAVGKSERDHLGNHGVDGRIISKLTLNE
jgi:hypothetical protein